jgi:urease accessory protein
MTRAGAGLRALASVSLGWLLVLANASTAYAHVGQGQAKGLLNGLRHPISGADHVLAMIAVGLWGAQLGKPAIWLLPVTFPMVMAFGGFLGLVGIPLPGIEVGIALSALLLGTMVAREVKPPMWAAAALVGFFAIFHGHAHGTELPAGQNGLTYSIGFVIATGCLHGVGIAIGEVRRLRGGRTLLRAAGAAVALAGVWFLWRAVA